MLQACVPWDALYFDISHDMHVQWYDLEANGYNWHHVSYYLHAAFKAAPTAINWCSSTVGCSQVEMPLGIGVGLNRGHSTPCSLKNWTLSYFIISLHWQRQIAQKSPEYKRYCTLGIWNKCLWFVNYPLQYLALYSWNIALEWCSCETRCLQVSKTNNNQQKYSACIKHISQNITKGMSNVSAVIQNTAFNFCNNFHTIVLEVAVWVSGNTLVSINEVILRRARLVVGWVTVCRQVNHLGM